MKRRYTKTQIAAWKAIAQHQLDHPYAPTVREIARAIGRTHSTAYVAIRVLEDSGIVIWPRADNGYRAQRGIQIYIWPAIEDESGIVRLPEFR
jgi:predicted transcriptional regulator